MVSPANERSIICNCFTSPTCFILSWHYEGAALRKKGLNIPPPTLHGNGFVIVTISLLFDGYAGGHPSNTPGVSVVPWRGRAAGPTVERGHKMCLTCPLLEPLHGKDHHSHPTIGALRRGKRQDPARGRFQTSACPPQMLPWSLATQSAPGERGPSRWMLPVHLVVNLCL